MQKIDLKAIVAQNVRDLAPKKPDGSVNIRALGKILGEDGNVSVGSAQRLISGETSIGVELIERFAEKIGIAPWMLLIPKNTKKPEIFRKDVFDLAVELQKLTPEQISKIRAMLLAFDTKAHVEQMSNTYKVAQNDNHNLRAAQTVETYKSLKSKD
jgi:hypothetical protein